MPKQERRALLAYHKSVVHSAKKSRREHFATPRPLSHRERRPQTTVRKSISVQANTTKRKGMFGLDDEKIDIPADLLPEKGWITPMSRKMGKRAKIDATPVVSQVSY
jgi:hypothetical protein